MVNRLIDRRAAFACGHGFFKLGQRFDWQIVSAFDHLFIECFYLAI